VKWESKDGAATSTSRQGTLSAMIPNHRNNWGGILRTTRSNVGRVSMYQSEMPYDVPDQSSWMSGKTNGFVSYKAIHLLHLQL
jgi:hypothetical protein